MRGASGRHDGTRVEVVDSHFAGRGRRVDSDHNWH
jgi:hypothetical protein